MPETATMEPTIPLYDTGPQYPKPGIYFDTPDSEYFQIPYASKSSIWKAHTLPTTIRTLDQARAWLRPTKPTYTMIFGRAFHDAMRLGDGWEKHWQAGPVNPRTGKGYGGDTKAFADAAGDNLDHTLVPEDIETINRMHEAMMFNPDVLEILRHKDAKHEVVLIWEDAITGIMCKCKIDLLTEYHGMPAHVDWKTWTKKRQVVENAVAFGWECEDRGYHVQGAHYLDGCAEYDKLMGRSVRERVFCLAPIQKTPEIIPTTGEEIFDVDFLYFSPDQLEGALRVRDTIMATWMSIIDGTWKPSQRGARQVVLSNRHEQNYAQ